MVINRYAVCALLVFGSLMAMWPQQARAQNIEWPAGTVGRCVNIRGRAELRKGSVHAPLQAQTQLTAGDTVITGEQATARLLIRDGSVLDLAPSTTLVLQSVGERHKQPIRLRTLLGKLWAHVMPHLDSEFIVEGPNAVAGVRGTSFVLAVDTGGTTTVTTLTGAVQVSDAAGATQLLQALQRSETKPGGTTSVSTVSPADVAALKSELVTRAILDPSGQAARFDQVAASTGKNGAPPSVGASGAANPGALTPLDRGIPTTGLSTAPTLNIDPGARLTHVRATIQLRP